MPETYRYYYDELNGGNASRDGGIVEFIATIVNDLVAAYMPVAADPMAIAAVPGSLFIAVTLAVTGLVRLFCPYSSPTTAVRAGLVVGAVVATGTALTMVYSTVPSGILPDGGVVQTARSIMRNVKAIATGWMKVAADKLRRIGALVRTMIKVVHLQAQKAYSFLMRKVENFNRLVSDIKKRYNHAVLVKAQADKQYSGFMSSDQSAQDGGTGHIDKKAPTIKRLLKELDVVTYGSWPAVVIFRTLAERVRNGNSQAEKALRQEANSVSRNNPSEAFWFRGMAVWALARSVAFEPITVDVQALVERGLVEVYIAGLPFIMTVRHAADNSWAVVEVSRIIENGSLRIVEVVGYMDVYLGKQDIAIVHQGIHQSRSLFNGNVVPVLSFSLEAQRYFINKGLSEEQIKASFGDNARGFGMNALEVLFGYRCMFLGHLLFISGIETAFHSGKERVILAEVTDSLEFYKRFIKDEYWSKIVRESLDGDYRITIRPENINDSPAKGFSINRSPAGVEVVMNFNREISANRDGGVTQSALSLMRNVKAIALGWMKVAADKLRRIGALVRTMIKVVHLQAQKAYSFLMRKVEDINRMFAVIRKDGKEGAVEGFGEEDGRYSRETLSSQAPRIPELTQLLSAYSRGPTGSVSADGGRIVSAIWKVAPMVMAVELMIAGLFIPGMQVLALPVIIATVSSAIIIAAGVVHLVADVVQLKAGKAPKFFYATYMWKRSTADTIAGGEHHAMNYKPLSIGVLDVAAYYRKNPAMAVLAAAAGALFGFALGTPFGWLAIAAGIVVGLLAPVIVSVTYKFFLGIPSGNIALSDSMATNADDPAVKARAEYYQDVYDSATRFGKFKLNARAFWIKLNAAFPIPMGLARVLFGRLLLAFIGLSFADALVAHLPFTIQYFSFLAYYLGVESNVVGLFNFWHLPHTVASLARIGFITWGLSFLQIPALVNKAKATLSGMPAIRGYDIYAGIKNNKLTDEGKESIRRVLAQNKLPLLPGERQVLAKALGMDPATLSSGMGYRVKVGGITAVMFLTQPLAAIPGLFAKAYEIGWGRSKQPSHPLILLWLDNGSDFAKSFASMWTIGAEIGAVVYFAGLVGAAPVANAFEGPENSFIASGYYVVNAVSQYLGIAPTAPLYNALGGDVNLETKQRLGLFVAYGFVTPAQADAITVQVEAEPAGITHEQVDTFIIEAIAANITEHLVKFNGQGSLKQDFDPKETATGLLASYGGDARIADWGMTYDQAAAVIAYAKGTPEDKARAKAILDFYKEEHDRTGKQGIPFKGFASAYNVATGAVEEYSYNNGPNAWLAIAIIHYTLATGDKSYLPMAESIGEWIAKLQNENGAIRGAPGSTHISTEENIDDYVMFTLLDEMSGLGQFAPSSLILRHGSRPLMTRNPASSIPVIISVQQMTTVNRYM
ncbi:MAG: hypothetical protein WC547_04145 [Candidatus Omnitrophota bacterium]